MEKMVKTDYKSILITGATGFVGGHLVDQLLARGYKSIICTTIEYDRSAYFFRKDLDKHVVLINLDIRDYEKVLRTIVNHQVDCIFHLAAEAIVEDAYKNPRLTYETNVMGTVNILEAARVVNNQVKGIVVASSDKAYGKLHKEKYVETDPLAGDHPYESSKSATDLIAQTYAKTYSLPVTITRFGNIYGEGDRNASRIIPSIMNAMHKNITLQLRSDGTHVRDYLYVRDVVEGYIALAENITKTAGKAFNFGSDDTYSVLDLIHKIEDILQRKIKYTVNNNAKNEIQYQSLDYSKVSEYLNWNPAHHLDSVIERIYADYLEVM